MMSVYVCSIKTHTERTRADFLSPVALFLHIEFRDHSANELRQFRQCKCFSVVRGRERQGEARKQEILQQMFRKF